MNMEAIEKIVQLLSTLGGMGILAASLLYLHLDSLKYYRQRAIDENARHDKMHSENILHHTEFSVQMAMHQEILREISETLKAIRDK